MYRKILKLFLITALMLISFSSCVVTEELTENKDYTGSSYTAIKTEEVFDAILADLMSITKEDDIVKTGLINFVNQLNASDYVSSAFLFESSQNENKYFILFNYESLTKLLEDLNNGKENTLLTRTENSLSFELNINNYSELKAVIPFLSDENFEVYGPEYSNGMTKDEYLEMISFLLGEDTPESLQNSAVNISITVPGTIVESEGITQIDDSTFLYSFPVIDFLLLNTPLSFSVSWE